MKEKNLIQLKKWELFRFSIIGHLLARPPSGGMLGKEFKKLASKSYRHPTQDKWITFGASTIERWYYAALNSDDPVSMLKRKVRKDSGCTTAMSPELFKALKKQYYNYPQWSYQLHADNLEAIVKKNPKFGNIPSYSTVTRCMKKHGFVKKKSTRNKTQGQLKAISHLETKEIRSYEAKYINELWHLDFHHGKRIVDTNGQWLTPKALCIIDDASRLCCHIQWYTDETAESLIHGLSQAIYKRGLPRSLMTDNGSAMIASETVNGLGNLGILHSKTLPYSPYQNGKQEVFWGVLEGRLMNMLSNMDSLTFDFLNHATTAWVEMEYNKKHHDGINMSPINKFIQGTNVARNSPTTSTLHFAFTTQVTRIQRRSDGTVQVDGIRFEVPARFRHIPKLVLRYQSWNRSMMFIIDEKNETLLATIYPVDKQKNATGERRCLETVISQNDFISDNPIPPLLKNFLEDFSATGMPASYIPQREKHADSSFTKKTKEPLK